MLKNGFLGRRDEAATPPIPSSSARASPETPRYPPEPNAPPLAAVAVTPPPGHAQGRTAEAKPAAPSSGDPIAASPTAPRDAGAPGTPRLTVGPNIKLKGAEINDCDTLVVEGHVEASMDSRTLEILATGSYEGTVTIDVAEIHGRFSGTLTARKKLIVHATGQVAGTVRYGWLLVSEGGVVSGDVASIAERIDPQQPLFAGYPSARAARGNGSGDHAHA